MTIKKKVSVWFEATLCVGVKTKRPTRNPVCLREIPVKVCGVCPRSQKVLGTALDSQVLYSQAWSEPNSENIGTFFGVD